MKPVVLLIVLLLAFLGGDGILGLVGYPHLDFTSSFIFRLHPLTYLASFLILYSFTTGQLKFSDLFSKMRNESIFLIACFIVICFLGVMNSLNGISFLLDALCLPALLSVLLKITDKKILVKFQPLIYLCFCLNACLAIIEKIRGASLISDGGFYFKDYFRSTALYGHPLNNALIMSVLTALLFFGTKKTALKIAVLIFGLLSIFCFGARGALVGVFLGILLNLLLTYIYLRQKKGSKDEERKELIKQAKSELMYLAVLGALSLIVVTFTGLGDRIVALSHIDHSAEARINSFNVLQGLDFSDLLWGYESSEIKHFQHNSGVQEIENFWIQWLLKFGLIATIFLAIFLFRFLYRMMSFIKKDIKFTLLFVSFFVASTNNSLATNTLVLSIFVLTCYIFFDNKEEEKNKKRRPTIEDLLKRS